MLTQTDRAKAITERRVRLTTTQSLSGDTEKLNVQLRDSILLAFQYLGLSKMGLKFVELYVARGTTFSSFDEAMVSDFEDMLFEGLPPSQIKGKLLTLSLGV
ncbi:hypothetical protein [Pseudomonas chlororaphis]|uniref:hypothetical protein n=1 Tax=Pseudomonas chlororaphis TaxID=587753 RepID=UPI00138A25AE|nr:hypothetical protein [Pseudomonas chlororaphis]